MADRQLIADLLSALEYHTEQTRPIEFSKVAIEAAREYLQEPAQQVVNSDEKAGAYMEARLWEFIDMAAAWPKASPDPRTWDHVMVYALKPTQQEPVAWGVFEGNLHDMFFTEAEAVEMAQLKGTYAEVKPLYTPPQRTWVDLTDKQIDSLSLDYSLPYSTHSFARAIESKLKEKNT